MNVTFREEREEIRRKKKLNVGVLPRGINKKISPHASLYYIFFSFNSFLFKNEPFP